MSITLQVDAPLGQAIGIKEALAMYCERFGDVRVVEVRETEPEQMTMFEGMSKHDGNTSR